MRLLKCKASRFGWKAKDYVNYGNVIYAAAGVWIKFQCILHNFVHFFTESRMQLQNLIIEGIIHEKATKKRSQIQNQLNHGKYSNVFYSKLCVLYAQTCDL